MSTAKGEVITLPRLFPYEARHAVAHGPLFDVPTGDPHLTWGYFRGDCRDILGALWMESCYDPPYYFTPRPERIVKAWRLADGAEDLALAVLRDLARRCDRGDFAERDRLLIALLTQDERQRSRAA